MSPKKTIIDENSSLKDRLEMHIEKHSFKDELIDSLRRELVSLSSSTAEIQDSLVIKNQQISKMNSTLSDKLNILDELQNDFQEKNHDLDRMKLKISEISEEEEVHLTISRLRSEIIDNEKKISQLNLQRSIEQRNFLQKNEQAFKEISELNRRVNEKDVCFDETVSQLNDKEVFIKQLNDDLLEEQDNSRSTFTKLESLNIRLKEKETEIINTRKGIASWIAKVKEQNVQLKSKDTEIVLLKSQFKALERQTIKLKSELKEKRNTPEKQQDKKSPYEILSLSPGCSFDEVKRAYRQAAKKYNPHIVDSLGDDVKELVTEACKEINSAFSWFKNEFGVS